MEGWLHDVGGRAVVLSRAMTIRILLSLSLLALLAPGCGGASVDRESTFTGLRAAMTRELPPGDADTLEQHNQLVENARDGNVFDGLRRSEVQEKLGRGQECGQRELCTRNGFRPDDWVYEIGQREGVPWGPTLIVGFDRQGIVDNVYTLTRR